MSGTNSTVQAMIQETLHELDLGYIYNLSLISLLSLCLYTTVLAIGEEVEYIWSRRFSVPSLLYILARYGNLMTQGLNAGINFLPPGRSCNALANAANTMDVLAYIGVQGLLIARAYTLCDASRSITGFLALGFFSGLVINLINIIQFNGCLESNYGGEEVLLSLINNISIIVTDALIFGICLWKVWGTWKLKRQSGIRGNSDIVSILLQQIVSRFCFVITITLTGTILNVALVNGAIRDILFAFQDTLSGIMVSDFTLNLRQRNSASMEVSNVSLSTLQSRDVLQHIHQSVLVEMGNHENIRRETETSR